MNERSIQGEVVKSVKHWGGDAYKVRDGHKCPQCGHVAIPPAGRADYDCTVKEYGFKVEVKYAERSFPLSDFREDQREWAIQHVQDTGGQYFLWLCMGKAITDKDLPRMAWLVPLRGWLAIEAVVLMYQKSLPYRAGRRHKKEMQRSGVDAIHLLRDFELDWWGKGVWMPRGGLLLQH
jgi:hypothetical protein